MHFKCLCVSHKLRFALEKNIPLYISYFVQGIRDEIGFYCEP